MKKNQANNSIYVTQTGWNYTDSCQMPKVREILF